MRGAASYYQGDLLLAQISIHAPHAGSGAEPDTFASLRAQFQSTLPMRGAAKIQQYLELDTKVFQSTLPMRGAALFINCLAQLHPISIHAPHAGSGIKPRTKR